jgi:hypothetical protein
MLVKFVPDLVSAEEIILGRPASAGITQDLRHWSFLLSNVGLWRQGFLI